MTITRFSRSRRAHRALSSASLTCAAALATAAGIGALGGSSRAYAEHIPYDIDRLGYVDTNHTRDTGARSLSGIRMNDVGHVMGNQVRYEGGGNLATGQTAWTFRDSMIRIGLFEEAQYIRASDQTQSSSAMFLNNAGDVAGESNRYFAASDPLSPNGSAGKAAWVYQNGGTSRIGLYDGVHSRSDGFQSSSVVGLSDSGHVVGNSIRYSGGNINGATAWINEPNSTNSTAIAPVAPEYVRSSDQFQESTVQFVNSLNEKVVAAGTSRRFHGATHATNPGGNAGQAAWVYSDGVSRKVGLTTGVHSSAEGEQSSSLQGLNKVGDAIGTSVRYGGSSGTSNRGQSAFLHHQASGTSNHIGLTNAEHTRSDDYKFSQATKLNDAGFAVGHSNRYNGTATQRGQSAWIAQLTSTERIGLTDAAHTYAPTAAESTQFSQVQHLNAVGHAAGTSSRYDAATGASRGQSAWLYNSGTTRIGFFDDTHRKSDGTQFSDVAALNDAGQVVGKSQRFDGTGTAASYSAYHYSEGLTTRIGLFDGVHVAPDGTQQSNVQFLNQAGQAAGFSLRYDPTQSTAVTRGFSGWFYDDDAAKTYPLVFSTHTDGTALTSISYLSDSGVVVGAYTLYNGAETVGQRGFFWDVNVLDDPTTPLTDERFHDLGAVVDGGLTAEGWASLNSATDLSELRHILGSGTLSDPLGGGSMPFLMTPIPEPTGLAMLALGGLALLPRRRR
ncbi:MAG TPA: hypothetical protein VGR35_09250 [Tepidisphaeraceae bacterium]|nr:hypothetical protein [Tepidisphaeraceae bacterium]